jgi:hypothetical protein
VSAPFNDLACQPRQTLMVRNEDLLTGRPTLGTPRSCHNA